MTLALVTLALVIQALVTLALVIQALVTLALVIQALVTLARVTLARVTLALVILAVATPVATRLPSLSFLPEGRRRNLRRGRSALGLAGRGPTEAAMRIGCLAPEAGTCVRRRARSSGGWFRPPVRGRVFRRTESRPLLLWLGCAAGTFRDRAPRKDAMLLEFHGLSRPVALVGCAELLEPIAAVLRGWRIDAWPDSEARTPAITIESTPAGYRRLSPWLSKPAVFTDALDAVCDFVVDLIKAYIADHPSLLCLHCAAAAFERGLVLFPSGYRAGKSTLAVTLAAHGVRLFSDDVLPIETSDNHGVAPGILPRLRLPLPESAPGSTDDRMRRFVRERAGPKNARYLYVALTEDELAPLGARAPVRGIVTLQRDPAARPKLVETRNSEMVKTAIVQNFARQVPAAEIIEHVFAITRAARCFTLRYARAEETVTLLEAAFGAAADAAPVKRAPRSRARRSCT